MTRVFSWHARVRPVGPNSKMHPRRAITAALLPIRETRLAIRQSERRSGDRRRDERQRSNASHLK